MVTTYYVVEDHCCDDDDSYIIRTNATQLLLEVRREQIFAKAYRELQEAIDELAKTDKSLAGYAANVLAEIKNMRSNFSIYSYSSNELFRALQRTTALIKTPLMKDGKINSDHTIAVQDCMTSMRRLRSTGASKATSGALTTFLAAIAITVTAVACVFAASFIPAIPLAVLAGIASGCLIGSSVRLFQSSDKHYQIGNSIESLVEASNRRKLQ